MPARLRPTARQAAFTLIEAIVAITITGIIAGVVAVFIKAPVDAYFDAARRAALTDVADTAVRRIGRDIRLALPNSVRNPVDGSDLCVEFMPTKIGGRYRAAQDSLEGVGHCDVGAAPCGDILDFTAVDAGFDLLWLNSALPAADRLAAGDIVVVYNDGYTGNAYTGSNAVMIAAAGVAEPGGTAGTTAISFVDAASNAPFNRKQFPAESPSYRFQVIPAAEHVVSYACVGAAPAMALTRYSRPLTATRPRPLTCAAMVADAASAAILAENLSTCSLSYEPPGSGTGAGRFGLVSMTLSIQQAGETVQLYHQVHVDNTP